MCKREDEVTCICIDKNIAIQVSLDSRVLHIFTAIKAWKGFSRNIIKWKNPLNNGKFFLIDKMRLINLYDEFLGLFSGKICIFFSSLEVVPIYFII